MKKRILSMLLVVFMLCLFLPVNETFAAAWKSDANGWWYETDDGSYLYGGFAYINGKNYYFYENGYMAVGWFQASSTGNWYYAGSSGRIYMDEYTPDGKYYLNAEGIWDGKTRSSQQTTTQLPSTTSAPTVTNKTTNTTVNTSSDRNIINATVDGVETTFYLTHTGSTESGLRVFTAYSLDDDGTLGGYITIKVHKNVKSGATLKQNKKNTVSISCKKSVTDKSSVTAGFNEKGKCEVTVTVNDDEHMEGTFSGKLERKNQPSVTIKNGTFNLYYDEKVDSVAEMADAWHDAHPSTSSGSTSYDSTYDDFSSGSSSSSSSYVNDHTCISCHGSGRCTSCAGRGEKRRSADGKLRDCGICHGSGKCSVCYGTGKIY